MEQVAADLLRLRAVLVHVTEPARGLAREDPDVLSVSPGLRNVFGRPALILPTFTVCRPFAVRRYGYYLDVALQVADRRLCATHAMRSGRLSCKITLHPPSSSRGFGSGLLRCGAAPFFLTSCGFALCGRGEDFLDRTLEFLLHPLC